MARTVSDCDVEYLRGLIREHVGQFFTESACEAVDGACIQFRKTGELSLLKGPGIALRTDAVPLGDLSDAMRVPFNGTNLTIWNRLGPPESGGWRAVPNDKTPLWYESDSQLLTPAFDFVGTTLGLVTLAEETSTDNRDKHGRFVGKMSPRTAASLIEVPAVNEAIAVLVAMCLDLIHGADPLSLEGAIAKPVVVLSHDADVLNGNDVWTQALRAWNLASPLLRLRPPRVKQFSHMWANARDHKDRYFADIGRMIAYEQDHRFTSTFYFLNGKRGVYGARCTDRVIKQAVCELKDGWQAGIHYNYETLLDHEAFGRQLRNLEALIGQRPVAGRAHFLRFDPCQSYSFLDDVGIQVDESVGYSDVIGFRAGLAGAYRPQDRVAGRALNLVEFPLAVMDGALLQGHPEDCVRAWKGLLRHVSRIGGALTLLFHPGSIENPENPAATGVYPELLDAATAEGFDGMAAIDFANTRLKTAASSV